MKRVTALLLSLALILALCPAIIPSAKAGGSAKIDLTPYVAGMTNASNFDQPVVTSSASYEYWGFGVAALIDGVVTANPSDPRYLGVTMPDGFSPIDQTAAFTPTWIQLDLQKLYTVDRLDFYAYSASGQGLPKDFTIQVSADGEAWTTVCAKTDMPLTDVPDSIFYSFSFNAADARYVKMDVTAIHGACDQGFNLCLREIEIYGTEKNVDEPGDVVPSGDRLGIDPGNVTVSDEYGSSMVKENLFDGDLDTLYAAIDPSECPGKRMDEWFQLDLQQPYTVTRIRLANRSNANPLGGMPTEFDILVSDDGETWAKVKSVSGITASDIKDECWLTVDVDPVQARYVRIRVYDIGGIGEAAFGYAVTLREFEVHTADGKIDLTSYAPDLDSWSGHPGSGSQWTYYASNYPQTVATASRSYELWGWGIAGLIDGVIATDGIFACAPNSDAEIPVSGMKDVITVDLKAAYFLNGMRFASIAENSAAGLPSSFRLEVSLDGAIWTTVLNRNGLTTDDADRDGRFYTFVFPDTDAIRFVRLTVTRVGGEASGELGYCTALSELELYGTLDPETVIKPDGYGKIDLSRALLRATNSYNLWGHGNGSLYNGDQTPNMFIAVSQEDADYYVRFKNEKEFENACEEFLKIRLDGIYEIDLMRFQSQWAGSGQGVPNKYVLEVSLDGKNWTPALSVDGQAVSDTDWYSAEFPTVQARYLRLNFYNVVEAGDLGYVPHLKELEFYGVLIEKDEIDLDVPAPIPPELDPIPATGAAADLLIFFMLTIASAALLLVLIPDRRRKNR
ncbi:MAG: discoidin domain-containing protein [Firmicutes bacterium]|nr:discoidin domain-containing protein [Bacillota bacterium]